MIPHVQLAGKLVSVTSMVQDDVEPLLEIARHAAIWEHLPCNGMDTDNLRRELKSAMLLKSTGEHHPFTIRNLVTTEVIGSTRFFDIFPGHKKLEVGWTWMHPQVWGQGYNIETKFLLLQYCFETLHFQRVQFKTRENNLRSQKAIEKIGAQFEGLLRKDRIGTDGTTRHTLVYSILDEEWPQVKPLLLSLIP